MVLRPIREHCPVSAVGYQLLWELGDFWVQIVHDVVYNALCLRTTSRVNAAGISHQSIAWTEAVHVNVSVERQFIQELGPELFVQRRREVPKSIGNCEFLLLLRETGHTFRGVWQMGGTRK